MFSQLAILRRKAWLKARQEGQPHVIAQVGGAYRIYPLASYTPSDEAEIVYYCNKWSPPPSDIVLDADD